MEFLVEFAIRVPDGTSESELKARVNAEAQASADLARDGNLVRLWTPPVAPGERKALGLYRAESKGRLGALLQALPLSSWMQTVVTPLETHPNDPTKRGANSFHLPNPPRFSLVSDAARTSTPASTRSARRLRSRQPLQRWTG
jgi:muconolactone D-isomerase